MVSHGGEKVHVWMRATRAELAARASLLISNMRLAPRQVCLAEGSAILDHDDGVAKTLDILRKYFAPDAVDAIHHKVVRFMRFPRADPYVVEYIAEYDLLRRKAESKMEIWTGFAEHIAPILRMDNAAPSHHEKPSVIASCNKTRRFGDASANMRSLAGWESTRCFTFGRGG